MQAGLLHCLQQDLAAMHIQLMAASVKRHVQATHWLGGYRLRVARDRRGKALQVNPRCGHPQTGQRLAHTLHKGLRTTDETFGGAPVGDRVGNGTGIRYTMARIEPVAYLQSLRIVALQPCQFLGEDHRVGITVGVEQTDSPAPLGQHRLQDRHQGRDATAGTDQQQIAIQTGRGKAAQRRQYVQAIARLQIVEQPVRGAAAGNPLDGDAQRLVGRQRARQRVTAQQWRLAARHLEGKKLTGTSGKAFTLFSRHAQFEGAGIGTRLHSTTDFQSDEFIGRRCGVRRSARRRLRQPTQHRPGRFAAENQHVAYV
ncbi:hypothetical protein D9M68_645800 [compost metagenome]